MNTDDHCKKNVSVESIKKEVIANKKLLTATVNGIFSDKAEMKFKCGKVIQKLSEDKPEAIYPYWDKFTALLDSENTFIKSIALAIIANLTKVDTEKKFEELFDKYFSFLNDRSMITAANLVSYSGAIAKAKPELESKITDKLVNIDKTHHSQECKNIIKGKAILSFHEYFDQSKDKKVILNFVKGELKNSRTATKKKAEKFLKKWNKESL